MSRRAFLRVLGTSALGIAGEWHPRLINGSDYPLPLVSLRPFVTRHFLPDAQAEVLAEIRRYKALLFDFVLKRSLTSGGQQFLPLVLTLLR